MRTSKTLTPSEKNKNKRPIKKKRRNRHLALLLCCMFHREAQFDFATPESWISFPTRLSFCWAEWIMWIGAKAQSTHKMSIVQYFSMSSRFVAISFIHVTSVHSNQSHYIRRNARNSRTEKNHQSCAQSKMNWKKEEIMSNANNGVSIYTLYTLKPQSAIATKMPSRPIDIPAQRHKKKGKKSNSPMKGHLVFFLAFVLSTTIVYSYQRGWPVNRWAPQQTIYFVNFWSFHTAISTHTDVVFRGRQATRSLARAPAIANILFRFASIRIVVRFAALFLRTV